MDIPALFRLTENQLNMELFYHCFCSRHLDLRPKQIFPLFCRISKLFSQKPPSSMFEWILNTCLKFEKVHKTRHCIQSVQHYKFIGRKIRIRHINKLECKQRTASKINNERAYILQWDFTRTFARNFKKDP